VPDLGPIRWNERLVAAARGGRDRTKIRAKGGGVDKSRAEEWTVRVIDEIFTRNAGW
jgi:hypothetical protein